MSPNHEERWSWEREFSKIHFVTEPALICPVCHRACIAGSRGVNLICGDMIDGKECEGVLETPPFKYQREVKDFISKLLSHTRQEVEEKEYKRAKREIAAAMGVYFVENYNYDGLSKDAQYSIAEFIGSFQKMLVGGEIISPSGDK